MKLLLWRIVVSWLVVCGVVHGFVSKTVLSSAYGVSRPLCLTADVAPASSTGQGEVNAKTVTKEIMTFFSVQAPRRGVGIPARDEAFSAKLKRDAALIDGQHVITILFQSARANRKARELVPIKFIMSKLRSWDREWSERDISTFVYGIRSLECIDADDGELLRLGAEKIKASSSVMTSRGIGNALYGLQSITSDVNGAVEICAALSEKLANFEGDLNGQDIGIGIYGLQGMSADLPEVRALIGTLADKIVQSEAELDAQALSNALYGLQSMSSDYPEVLRLVSALATKVAEARPVLSAQAIGAALYGLQKLSSDALEVRTLVAAMSEKVEISTEALDAQAIGNGLFGLQRMKTTSAEVRALVQALATKMVALQVEMDSKGIGSALYGLSGMSDDQPQVRQLISALADRIAKSDSVLSGQSISDALFGLRGMTSDGAELRSLLTALASRIDSTQGKLDSQEIGNALYGLQGMSSEIPEVRLIVKKLAEKLQRSSAILRSQHIGRALLGLQRISASSPEVRFLLRQLSKRIAASDRTKMTSAAIADSLFGLQGMADKGPEVQELLSELAKKISVTAAEMNPDEVGRALFGLQGLSSQASIFAESALGIDSDEVQFLLSTLWDKIKMVKGPWGLGAIAMGLQGITLLRDPLADKIRQFLYYQCIRLGESDLAAAAGDHAPLDVIGAVRSVRLNNLLVPRWLADNYNVIEAEHSVKAIVPQSRADKLIVSKYLAQYPAERGGGLMVSNSLIDGIRLDMDFPELKLNFELDGATHSYPSRALFDKERDEYLSVKKGYKVSACALSVLLVFAHRFECPSLPNLRAPFLPNPNQPNPTP